MRTKKSRLCRKGGKLFASTQRNQQVLALTFATGCNGFSRLSIVFDFAPVSLTVIPGTKSFLIAFSTRPVQTANMEFKVASTNKDTLPLALLTDIPQSHAHHKLSN